MRYPYLLIFLLTLLPAAAMGDNPTTATDQLGGPLLTPVGAERAGNTAGLTGLIYRGIRGPTRLVGGGLDAAMAPINTLLPDHVSSTSRDAFVSAMN